MRALLGFVLTLALASPALGAAPAKRTKVAVPEVRERAGVAEGSVAGLAGVLADEAAQRPSTDVVTAAEIQAMIGLEQQKQLLGCADEAGCLAEIGGALGADLLLASELTKIGGRFLLSVSLVDVRRARVIARTTRETGREDELLSSARDAAAQVLDAFAPVSTGLTGGEIASLSAAGGGLVLGAAGAVLYVLGAGEVDEATGSGTFDAAAQEKEASGSTKKTAGLVLGIAGAAALVGGAVAWPLTGDEGGSVALAPTQGGGLLAWSRSF